jgi:pimeloyl-ACP methyl ester carboxylesterase
LHFAEGGTGKPVLVLHGGGGTATVAEITQHFEAAHHVIMPTHPGWNGTARPVWLDSVDELALLYLRFVAQRGMRDVLVIGSSYAKALGNARFELVPKAGHLPQLEQPEATFALIDGFATADAMDRI